MVRVGESTGRWLLTLLQVKLPKAIEQTIRDSTQSYGKVKLVLQRNRFWVESPYPVRPPSGRRGGGRVGRHLPTR